MLINKFCILALFFLTASCTRNVLKQPISEIDRPQTKPHDDWQISAGTGLARVTGVHRFNNLPIEVHTRGKGVIDFNGIKLAIYGSTYFLPIIGIAWPTIPLGKHVELSIPHRLIIHLVKNISVSDSIEYVSGPNLAVYNHFSWEDLLLRLYYHDSYYGIYRQKSEHGALLKIPLTKTLWFESRTSLTLYYPKKTVRSLFSLMLDVPLCLGFQLAKQWSLTGTGEINTDYNHLHYKDPREGYTETTVDLNLSFPIRLNYTVNHIWDFSLTVQPQIFEKGNYAMAGLLCGTATW